MEPIPTSLKFQFVSGSSPTLHKIDQRVSTGMYRDSAHGDEHTTFYEVDPLTGNVGQFIARVAGVAKALILPMIHAVVGVNLETPVLDFLLAYGDEFNAQLAKENIQGHSVRMALMDMQEQ